MAGRVSVSRRLVGGFFLDCPLKLGEPALGEHLLDTPLHLAALAA